MIKKEVEFKKEIVFIICLILIGLLTLFILKKFKEAPSEPTLEEPAKTLVTPEPVALTPLLAKSTTKKSEPKKIISPIAHYQTITIIMNVKDFHDIHDCNLLGEDVVSKMEGCYSKEDNVIYIKETGLKLPKDFAVYHEIGHFKFNDNYPKELFADQEIMADQFGFWIFKKKYPYKNELTAERIKFFENNCDKDCVDEILNIPIPDIESPIKPFYFRE